MPEQEIQQRYRRRFAGITIFILIIGLLLNASPISPTWAAPLAVRPDPFVTLRTVGINVEPSGLPERVDSYNALYFRWSPDGRYLAFGRDGDLFIYDARIRRTRNLTNTPDRWELMPSWSPQGDQIAFVSRPLEPGEGSPTKPGAAPWVMQGCFCGRPAIIGLHGSGYQEIAEESSSDPVSWAPDGATVAYAADGRIHLYSLETQAERILRAADLGLDATHLGAPSWSSTRPELSLFFAQNDRPPTREELLANQAERVQQGYAVLDLERQTAQIVHQYGAPFAARAPALWSSDGNKLALLFKPGLLVAEPMGLVVVDRDGRQVDVVAEHAYQAAWEPRGARLAYLNGDDPREIYILSPTGTGWHARIREFDDYLQGFAWRATEP